MHLALLELSKKRLDGNMLRRGQNALRLDIAGQDHLRSDAGREPDRSVHGEEARLQVTPVEQAMRDFARLPVPCSPRFVMNR